MAQFRATKLAEGNVQRKLQHYVDKTTVWTKTRHLGTVAFRVF